MGRKLSGRLHRIQGRLEPWSFDLLARKSYEATLTYSLLIADGENQFAHGDANMSNVVRNRHTGAGEMIDLDGLCLSSHEMDLLPAFIRQRRFLSEDSGCWEGFKSAYYANKSSDHVFDEDYLARLSSIKETMMNTWLADHALRHDTSLLSELYHRLRTWDSNDRGFDSLWSDV